MYREFISIYSYRWFSQFGDGLPLLYHHSSFTFMISPWKNPDIHHKSMSFPHICPYFRMQNDHRIGSWEKFPETIGNPYSWMVKTMVSIEIPWIFPLEQVTFARQWIFPVISDEAAQVLRASGSVHV